MLLDWKPSKMAASAVLPEMSSSVPRFSTGGADDVVQGNGRLDDDADRVYLVERIDQSRDCLKYGLACGIQLRPKEGAEGVVGVWTGDGVGGGFDVETGPVPAPWNPCPATNRPEGSAAAAGRQASRRRRSSALCCRPGRRRWPE